MSFHEVHCPRCGNKMSADQLAFDFGRIINIALEKDKNKDFAATDEWYDLTKFNLCLYLTLEDLKSGYHFVQTADGSYEGRFDFTTEHLSKQILKLANSSGKIDIKTLAEQQPKDCNEYNKLVPAMATSADIDKHDLAADIQNLLDKILRNPNTLIASFGVTVYMQEDDQKQYFANRLLVEFDDGYKKPITEFVCQGRKGKPCGKVLFGHAGRYQEIIIGLAGTARVGKTAYLASLLACIMRKGNGINQLGHVQDVVTNIAYADDAYKKFEADLLGPYLQCEKIKKTENIFEKFGDTEAISLFSLTFSIKKDKKYIFTFIDMPGETFDDSEGGNDAIDNNRQIIKDASMIWLCIAPAQVAGAAVSMGSDNVNTDIGTAFANLSKTMSTINKDAVIPTAVLLTCSDLIDGELWNPKFNPFAGTQNPMKVKEEKTKDTPWVDQEGNLYYSNMQWFIKETYEYLNTGNQGGFAQSVSDIFGSFTPFAIASYGKNIGNPLREKTDNEMPEPSMVEAPFLWTLAVLGILPVCQEEQKTFEREERTGLLGWRRNTVKYQQTVIERIKPEELKEKLFYHKI